MTGQRIGYIRVSTFDQNPERQLEGKDLTVLMKNPKASWVKTSLTVLATITTAFDPNATATSLTPMERKNFTITKATVGNGRISPIIRNTRR